MATSRLLITPPEGFTILFHHSYMEDGFELVIARCRDCNRFHYMLQSFEYTNHVTEEARDEPFEELVKRLYIETKNLTDRMNWLTYQDFKARYHVS